MHRFAAIAVLFIAPAFAQKPYDLATEGDNLTLTIGEGGLAVTEFVKLAQRVTGRAIAFSASELADAEAVRLIGTVRMPKDAFLPFFQTMLYVKGLGTQIRNEGGTEVLEIVALPATGRDRPGDARYVAATELGNHKESPAPILTSIALTHVAPGLAIERVRAALAASGIEVTLGQVAKAMLVQGSGADVHCVWRMVRLIDAPPAEVFELVRLRHAVAAELTARLQTLLAGRQPAVVVLAHAGSNALLISGPRAVVDETVEVAGLLDRPAREAKAKK